MQIQTSWGDFQIFLSATIEFKGEPWRIPKNTREHQTPPRPGLHCQLKHLSVSYSACRHMGGTLCLFWNTGKNPTCLNYCSLFLFLDSWLSTFHAAFSKRNLKLCCSSFILGLFQPRRKFITELFSPGLVFCSSHRAAQDLSLAKKHW